jgi:hypothetical protein
MQLNDRIAPLMVCYPDVKEYEIDEEELSGIPEGFDQGTCAVTSEAIVEEPSESSDSEENSDETELINALCKFMTKDKLSKKGKGEKRTVVARLTNQMPFLMVRGWILPILLRA